MFESKGVRMDLREEMVKIMAKEFENYIDKQVNMRTKYIQENKNLLKNIKRNAPKHKFKFYSRLGAKFQVNEYSMVPKGQFCFPLKTSPLVESNYELNFIPVFDSLKKFETTREDVSLVQDFYHFYPETEREVEVNQQFLIWCFIQIINQIHFQYNIEFNAENVFRVIEHMNSILKVIKIKYIYRIISKFLGRTKKYIERINNSEFKISNYKNYYCQICREYLCRNHFYNSSTEKNFIGLQIAKSNLVKLSGNRDFLTDKADTKKENSEKENEYRCHSHREDCYLNCPESHPLVGASEDEMKTLFSSILKDDFYIIYSFTISHTIINSCLFSKMFNYKYKCSKLKKIIQLIQQKDEKPEIKILLKELLSKNFLIENRIITIYFSSNPSLKEIKKKVPKVVHVKKIGNNVMDYIPCNHYGECVEEVCDCAKRGACEKYCMCNSRGTCKILFKGCNCKNGCKRGNDFDTECCCECIKDGRECDPDYCVNCNRCSNMNIYYKNYKKTVIGKSTLIDGSGLFAYEDIKKFDLIGVYEGEIVEKNELERRGLFNEMFDRNYGFNLTEKFDVDAGRCGNAIRYVNHSSFGYENSFAVTIYVRGIIKNALIALRNIRKGEEIFFDYQMKKLPWVAEYDRKYRK